MAVRVVRCPNEHTIRVPDEAAGRKIKCKECGAVFVVPGGAAKAPAGTAKRPAGKPAPKPGPVTAKKPAGPPPKRRRRDEEDDDDDRPRKRRRVDEDDDDEDEDDSNKTPLSPEDRRKERLRDRRQRLKKVDLGLLLHTIKMWAAVVMLFAVILTVIFTSILVGMATAPQELKLELSRDALRTFAMMAGVFMIFSLVCIVAAPLVGVVGSGFCLMIPKKSGAGGTILTSFVADILSLVGLFVAMLGAFGVFGLEAEKNARLVQYILMGCGFLTVTAMLLFMVFLRNVCLYMQKPLLGSDSLNLVMFFCIQIVTFPAMLYFDGLVFGFGLRMMGAVGGIGQMFILNIVWFAQYYYLFHNRMLRLLTDIRDAMAPPGKKKEDEEEDEEDEDEDEEDDDD